MALDRKHLGRESALLVLSLVVLGATVGVLTVTLSLAVAGAATIFSEHTFSVWLLPVAGFATYGIYRVFRLDYSWNTSRVMGAIREGRMVPAALAPAIMVGTFLTVLCGGSVGIEAAALQMGAAVGNIVPERDVSDCRKLFARAAMAAALGAMLGTPLAGAVFCFESLRERPDSIRCATAPLVSSFVAWAIADASGVAFFDMLKFPVLIDIESETVILVAALGVCAGLLSLFFCSSLGILRKGLARLGAPVFALAAGGVVTALIVGYADLFHYEGLRVYCGTGAAQVEAALLGTSLPWWAFLVKMALTLLTFAGGFKGGEIMPVLAIGACLGSAISIIVGSCCATETAYLGLVLVEMGIVSFFAACTNCPLTALTMCFEVFGMGSTLLALVAIAPAFLISRSSSLYPTTIPTVKRKTLSSTNCSHTKTRSKQFKLFRGNNKRDR